MPPEKTFNKTSPLTSNLKSRIIERGYINVYSELHANERRALNFQRQYKQRHPNWDNTSIRLCQEFGDFLDLFRKNHAGLPTILDAGCGHGNYVIDEYRKDIGWACGVDVNPTFTNKNICLDEIIFSRLEKLPFPDSSFNAVLSLWVLEHLEHPAAVFRELYRVLKPGGSFIFCTPNKKSLLVSGKRVLSSAVSGYVNLKAYGRQHEDIFPTFYRANDIKNLRQEFQQAGFRDRHINLNFDPGYTSFNSLSFALTDLFESMVGKITPTISKMHIVGHVIAEKS